MTTAGQVKGLAVTSAKRIPLAPDYPAMEDSGLPGMDQTSWYGVWAPKRLSADLAAEFNSTINNAVKELEANGRLKMLGVTPITETVPVFERFAKDYRSKSADLLKPVNFEPMKRVHCFFGDSSDPANCLH